MRRGPTDVEQLGEHGVATFGTQAGAPCSADGRRTHRWPRIACPSRHPRRRRRARRAPTPDRQFRPRPAAAATPPGGPRPAAEASRPRSGRGRRPRRPARSARRRPRPPPPGRVRRGDLHQHARAAGAGEPDQIGTESERERHPRHPLLDHQLEALVLCEVEHEVHAKRTIRDTRDRTDLLTQHRRLRPRRAQRAEAAGPRHRGSQPRRGPSARAAPASAEIHSPARSPRGAATA